MTVHEAFLSGLWMVLAACVTAVTVLGCKIYQRNLPGYVPRHSAKLQQQARQPLAIEAARQNEESGVTLLSQWLSGYH